MKKIQLEKQVLTEPIDEETMAALEVAEAQYRRGEVVTMEEVEIYLKEQKMEWRKARKEN